jgi:hypothetical protein
VVSSKETNKVQDISEAEDLTTEAVIREEIFMAVTKDKTSFT